MYACKTGNWVDYKRVMVRLKHSQLYLPTNMLTITKEQIKEEICAMIDKAVDSRNSEVCLIDFK